MKAWMRTCFFLSLPMFLHGCSTPETRILDHQVIASNLPFIRVGEITRSEILDQLGKPASFFEDGMIVIYWLVENDNGVLEVVPKNATAIRLLEHSVINSFERRPRRSRSGYYNLVLVFGNNDILEEYSLVFIR